MQLVTIKTQSHNTLETRVSLAISDEPRWTYWCINKKTGHFRQEVACQRGVISGGGTAVRGSHLRGRDHCQRGSSQGEGLLCLCGERKKRILLNNNRLSPVYGHLKLKF